jgi:3-oxoacyl-[acyl-carrier protein] reductase
MAVRQVALISDAADYVGPALARLLAPTHDLVVGDPQDGLVGESRARGRPSSRSELFAISRDPPRPTSSWRQRSTRCRLDAAIAFTGRIVVGRFVRSSVEDLRTAITGCVEAPYHFLRCVVPTMAERGGGQILVFTSAAGARSTPGAPLYSSARAAANMRALRNLNASLLSAAAAHALLCPTSRTAGPFRVVSFGCRYGVAHGDTK